MEALSLGQDGAQGRDEGDSEAATTEENPDEPSSTNVDTAASGKATYFFRIMPRSDHANAREEEMAGELGNFIKTINRCMIDINFRREPIFLSDDELDSPKYAQYRFAVAKIPSLRTLRNLFIGRVIHSSFDQWKNDITNLLEFIINSKHDNEKWKKGAN
jgi:hypothetical protein